MDATSIIVHIAAVLPNQIRQDRKLLLPLTSTRQLLTCTSNTGASCFASLDEHSNSHSGTHLAKESCISCPVLNTPTMAPKQKGPGQKCLAGRYIPPQQYLNICSTNTGTLFFASPGKAVRVPWPCLALSTVPSFLSLPLLYCLFLCLHYLALLKTSLPCFTWPSTLWLAFHAGKEMQTKAR